MKTAESCDKPTDKQQQQQQPVVSSNASPPRHTRNAFFHNDESDSEWDFGIGNLVIDLDAEQGGVPISTGAAPSGGDHSDTESNMNSGTNCKNSPTKFGSAEQASAADKGLKMKIKRTKNLGNKTDKHEIVKTENKAGGAGVGGGTMDVGVGGGVPQVGVSVLDRYKQSLQAAAAQDPKKTNKGPHKKDKRDKMGRPVGEYTLPNGVVHPGLGLMTPGSGITPQGTPQGNDPGTCTAMSGQGDHPRPGGSTSYSPRGGRDTPATHDPYEFNAKVEDRIGFPVSKKIKVEKSEVTSPPSTSAISPPQQHPAPPQHGLAGMSLPYQPPGPQTSPLVSPGAGDTEDKAVETHSMGVVTDPDCLGPCEPGTHVTLEGIVWHETTNGVLVVNVTWRGKTYVGTLLDATKHDWAPPRFSCDSPTSDYETRTPKGRGKRGRGAATPKVEPVSVSERRLRNRRVAPAPPSPARCDPTPVVGRRRCSQMANLESLQDEGPSQAKRSRSTSRSTPPRTTGRDSPVWIECPEPDCFKKYRHMNGLKYHQTRAHPPASRASVKEEARPQVSSSGRKTSVSSMVGVEAGRKSNLPAAAGSERALRASLEAAAKADKDNQQDKDTSKSPPCAKAKDNADTGTKQLPGRPSAASKNGRNNKKGAGVVSPQENKAMDTSMASGRHTSDVSVKSEPDNSPVKDDVYNQAAKMMTNVDTRPRRDMTASDGKKDTTPPNNDSKKSDKPGLPGALQIDSPVGLPAVGSNAQMYQLPGTTTSCISSITVMSPSVPSQLAVTAASVVQTTPASRLPVATMAAVPITVTTVTPVSSVSEQEKYRKNKVEKTDRLKPKVTGTRPIVPAPTPGASHPAHGMASNIGPQVSSLPATQLKPIQPKPTIMGETAINPALSSLRDIRDKKNKKKKASKEKERGKDGLPAGNTVSAPSIVIPTAASLQQQMTKPLRIETDSVIKSTPASGQQGAILLRAGHEQGYNQGVLQTVQSMHSKPPDLVKVPELTKPPELQKQPVLGSLDGSTGRIARPPSSLSLNSPLAPSDGREHSSDVHSPAYSDISDANDSAPTLENENEQKPISENKSQEPIIMQKSRAHDIGPGYHVYDSAGQPPYLIPAVPHPEIKHGQDAKRASPSVNKPAEKQGESEDNHNDDVKITGQAMVAGESKGIPQDYPNVPSDKLMHPQYLQYQRCMGNMSAYGSAIDHAYHLHLMRTDPQYRAQHEKLRSEKNQKDKEGASNDGQKEGDPIKIDVDKKEDKVEGRGQERMSMVSPGIRSTDHRPVPPKPPSLVSDREREEARRKEMEDARKREAEKTEREKKNENRQILRESIEVMNPMDGRIKQEGGVTTYEKIPPGHHERSQAEYRQQQFMYAQQQQQQQRFLHEQQQQRFFQQHGSHQQHIGDGDRASHGKHAENVRPSSREARERDQENVKHMDLKRQSTPSREGRPREREQELRRTDEKIKHEKSPSPRPSSRSTPTKVKTEGNQPQTVNNNRAMGPSIPVSYAQFYPGYPHYANQIPIDPRHAAAMYPGMGPVLGYPGHPGAHPGAAAYMHPSQVHPGQVRFAAMPAGEADREKVAMLSPGAVPEGKALDILQQRAHYYSSNTAPAHKIHELKEAARKPEPSPSKTTIPVSTSSTKEFTPASTEKRDAASPAGKATTPVGGTPGPGSGGKDAGGDQKGTPPLQRHVHTHHHTHVIGHPTPPYQMYSAGYNGGTSPIAQHTYSQKS